MDVNKKAKPPTFSPRQRPLAETFSLDALVARYAIQIRLAVKMARMRICWRIYDLNKELYCNGNRGEDAPLLLCYQESSGKFREANHNQKPGGSEY